MEVFAQVARLDIVRVLLALAAQFGWEVFQLDVKSAFLHGKLKEELEGFVKNGKEDKVYKLKKALYGLKQAPSMCEKFKSSMMLEFDMSDLGRMRHFLGIEVIQSDAGIFICQRRYAREVLARFNMANSNPVRNPIVLGTILLKDEDGVEVDATKFMANPKEAHWAATKRLLKISKRNYRAWNILQD
ncbi:hypothetical protein CR513_19659, partial [Mucuna pruriens]